MVSAAGDAVCFEGVKKLVESVAKLLEGCPVNAVAAPWAFHCAFDEAGFFQLLQVLAYGALCQGNYVYDLAANTFVACRQYFQDSHAGRMGQSLGKGGHFLLARGEYFRFRYSHNRIYSISICKKKDGMPPY
jgi:hypothetical protein